MFTPTRSVFVTPMVGVSTTAVFVGGVYVWLLHPANANTRPKAATQHRANFNTRFIRAFPSNRTVHAFRPRTMHAVQQRPVLGAIGRKALEASLYASSS